MPNVSFGVDNEDRTLEGIITDNKWEENSGFWNKIRDLKDQFRTFHVEVPKDLAAVVALAKHNVELYCQRT